MRSIFLILLFVANGVGASLPNEPGLGVTEGRTLAQREDPFFLNAEVLKDKPIPEDEILLDESGWDGQVEQLEVESPDRYADVDYSRIFAVAAVERSKCKPQEGLASWYGGHFHGRKTASGERFDAYAKTDMTAAHRTLPMGTRVRVTNRQNGLSVIVRINDRGPFVRNRVIDVSREAAKALRIVSGGTGRVQLTCI